MLCLLAARALNVRSMTSLDATLPSSRAHSSLSTPSAADRPRLRPRGRQGASWRTCQRAARRPQARPKVRHHRRTARAPIQRPRRASRRASARTYAHALLTRYFRLSTETCSRSPCSQTTSRAASRRSPRDAHDAARFVGGGRAGGERGRGASWWTLYRPCTVGMSARLYMHV